MRHTVCGRAGGGVVGWNMLMAINPVGQAAYRTRAHAAANLPVVEPRRESLSTIKVLVVDRGGLKAGVTRSFINEVRPYEVLWALILCCSWLCPTCLWLTSIEGC